MLILSFSSFVRTQGPQGFGVCLELRLWLSSLFIKIMSAYRPQSHSSKSLIKKFILSLLLSHIYDVYV